MALAISFQSVLAFESQSAAANGAQWGDETCRKEAAAIREAASGATQSAAAFAMGAACQQKVADAATEPEARSASPAEISSHRL